MTFSGSLQEFHVYAYITTTTILRYYTGQPPLAG